MGRFHSQHHTILKQVTRIKSSVNSMSSTTSTAVPTTNEIASLEFIPDIVHGVCTVMEESCIKSVLRRLDKLLKASNDTTFDRNRDHLLSNMHSPPDLHGFIQSYMPDINDCLLSSTDKTNLRVMINSLLIKPTEPPLSINGRLGMVPYNNPEMDETETLAYRLYTEFLATCKSPYTIELVTDAITLLKTSIRVRSYVDCVNQMEVKTSRHAPVTRETGYIVHNLCNCDKHNKGIVRISGCAKCCVNMPKKVSVCKCQQHFKLWRGHEQSDMLCNHPGQFDARKFSMMYLKTHICSICSEQTDGHCQHRVFALDADALYYSDVANPADIDYIYENLTDFNDAEEVFHYKMRKRAMARDRKSAEQKDCKRRCGSGGGGGGV